MANWQGPIKRTQTLVIGSGAAGLYRTSVYPHQQTGAIGLALLAGAAARNLPESQLGRSL